MSDSSTTETVETAKTDPAGWSNISRAAREASGLDQQALADLYNDWIGSLGDEHTNPHQFKAFLAGVALVKDHVRSTGTVVKTDERDPKGSCHSAEPEPASGLSPTGECQSRNEWHPIETAPKDGRGLLLCVTGYEPCSGMWLEKWPTLKHGGCWVSFNIEGKFENDEALDEYLSETVYEPDFWQPLPASATEAGGRDRQGSVHEGAARRETPEGFPRPATTQPVGEDVPTLPDPSDAPASGGGERMPIGLARAVSGLGEAFLDAGDVLPAKLSEAFEHFEARVADLIQRERDMSPSLASDAMRLAAEAMSHWSEVFTKGHGIQDALRQGIRGLQYAREQEAALATRTPRRDAEPGGEDVPAYGIIDPDYARVFTMARCIAWSEGYALLMHGSFTRDLDLLAVPWAEQATDAEHLVKRIALALNDLDILVKNPEATSQATEKPHGRRSWTLTFKAFGDPRFVDIGVMPSTPSRAESPKPAVPAPEPQAESAGDGVDGVRVERIKCVTYASGFKEPAEPCWRVVVGPEARCFDFETEQPARLLCLAIGEALSARPHPVAAHRSGMDREAVARAIRDVLVRGGGVEAAAVLAADAICSLSASSPSASPRSDLAARATVDVGWDLRTTIRGFDKEAIIAGAESAAAEDERTKRWYAGHAAAFEHCADRLRRILPPVPAEALKTQGER